MNQTKQQKITASIFQEVAAETKLIPIFPAGITTGHDGRGPYVLNNPSKVIESSRRANVDLVIDRDHASDLLPPGQPRPAAGWIKKLIEQDGAIFAEVDWTPKGQADLDGREYRYISPTFNFNPETREVTQILRATLTNTPNFDMKAVASEGADDALNSPTQDPKEIKEMKTHLSVLTALASVLCLNAASTPEDYEAALNAKLKEVDTLKAELASVRSVLKLDDKADTATVLSTATAAMATASALPDPAKYVPMEAHKAVLDKLATVQTTTASEKASQAVEDAVKAGKIAPAQRKWATDYASSDLKGFEDYIKTAPVIVTASEQIQGDPKGQTATSLDQTETEVCSMLGVKSDDYQKAKSA